MLTLDMSEDTERQIDETAESYKLMLLPKAKNQREADEIRRRVDAIGHELKAILALNDGNVYKAALHKILSQVRRD